MLFYPVDCLYTNSSMNVNTNQPYTIFFMYTKFENKTKKKEKKKKVLVNTFGLLDDDRCVKGLANNGISKAEVQLNQIVF